MAGGLDFHKLMKIQGKLKPATTSLQNCLTFSHDHRYLSLLCDFGVALIIEFQESDNLTSLQANICKNLVHGYGETLEGQSWSPDSQIYAVLGYKAYLYQVSSDFSLLHAIQLYYIPKDVTIATSLSTRETDQLKYTTAIAGPNGVEIFDLEVKDSKIHVKEGLHLHADLAIVLVEFSPDLQYLAVAALDCHFGIWNVQSLAREQKDFWYKHLSTVRITNMAFSHDSQSIAVTCWDGVCYLYTRVQPSTQANTSSSQWVLCNHIIQSSGERVCGTLTGTLVCWAPDSKSVRFSYTNDEGSWLNTNHLNDEGNWTENVSPKGVEVKGMDTLRCAAGDFSICYLSSEQLLLTKWDVQYKKVMSCKSNKISSEVLLYEDLVCSVWLILDQPQQHTGVTLRWRYHSDEQLKQVKNLCTELRNDAQTSSSCKNNSNGFSRSASHSSTRCSEKQSEEKNKTVTEKISASLSSCTVNVPFYEPSALPTRSTIPPYPKHFVLASRTCIILMVLPSVAYVYYRESAEWKSIVFRESVVSCCLVQENVFTVLSDNGVLSAWHLTRNSCLTCLSSLQIEGLQTKRTLLVGDLLEPLVCVFEPSEQGEGTVTYISLQDDTLALTKENEPVCIPKSVTFCSMVDCCVFFCTKECNSCGVLIPELNAVCNLIYGEPHSSLYQCMLENKEKLLHFMRTNKQK